MFQEYSNTPIPIPFWPMLISTTPLIRHDYDIAAKNFVLALMHAMVVHRVESIAVVRLVNNTQGGKGNYLRYLPEELSENDRLSTEDVHASKYLPFFFSLSSVCYSHYYGKTFQTLCSLLAWTYTLRKGLHRNTLYIFFLTGHIYIESCSILS